jgi:hypothetical protein
MRSLLLAVLLLIILSSSCRKNKASNPVDQLPPATQSGAGTFGCLVNGKAFLPKGNPLGGPILSCAYQYIDGGYYFQLKGLDKGSSANYGVGIFTDSLKIQTGAIYTLSVRNKKEQAYGLYSISKIQGLTNYTTNSTDTGQLKITKLDETNRVVSGTFWFDGVNDNGEKVQVREGRFDMHYTL